MKKSLFVCLHIHLARVFPISLDFSWLIPFRVRVLALPADFDVGPQECRASWLAISIKKTSTNPLAKLFKFWNVRNEQQVHLKAITKQHTRQTIHRKQKNQSKMSGRDIKQVLVGIRKRNPQNWDGMRWDESGELVRWVAAVWSSAGVWVDFLGFLGFN